MTRHSLIPGWIRENARSAILTARLGTNEITDNLETRRTGIAGARRKLHDDRPEMKPKNCCNRC